VILTRTESVGSGELWTKRSTVLQIFKATRSLAGATPSERTTVPLVPVLQNFRVASSTSTSSSTEIPLAVVWKRTIRTTFVAIPSLG